MKNHLKPFLVFSSLVISFVITGCSHAETKNVNSGQVIMNKANMKNWCIGRYTYQLPVTASLVGGTDRYESLYIQSELNSNYDGFQKAYSVQQLKFSKPNMTIIEDRPEQKIDGRIVKVLLARYGKDVNIANDIFVWILDGKTLFSITGTYSEEFKPMILEAISNLSQNLVARNNNVIPSQDGICVINGLIKYSGQPFKHSINEHGFKFNNAPSIRVYTTAQSISRPTADFIKRAERKLSNEGLLAKLSSSNKTIRKGSKSQTSGDKLSGVEWLVDAPMKGRSGIIATWEHMGTPKNTLDQQVRIEVDTADSSNNVETSSMAENEAIIFYETLLNTIKKF